MESEDASQRELPCLLEILPLSIVKGVSYAGRLVSPTFIDLDK